MSKEIQKHFSHLERALVAAVKESQRYNEEVEKVKSNKSLSKTGQEKQIKPLTVAHEEYAGDLYSIVKDAMEALEAAAKDLDTNLDFVGDPDLANALRIIEYVGSGAPEELVQSLNLKYGSNPVAARTLKAFYRKHSIPVFGEELNETGYASLLRNVDDSLYYTFTQGGDLTQFASQIKQLAEAFGCQFGISTAEEPKPGSSSMRAVQTYQDYVSQGPVL